MKKSFLLLPLSALVLTACSSNNPAPVVNANNSDLSPGIMQPVGESVSTGWQSSAQPAPVPSYNPQPMPTYSTPQPVMNVPQPVATPQPTFPAAQPPRTETKTVTETVKVKKRVPKKTTPQDFEIPRDANNKPVYGQINKGFYNGQTYTVRKGDTMYLIGYISGKDVNEIARLNNMSEPFQLAVGQKIKLSNGPEYEEVEVEEKVTKQVQVQVEPKVTYAPGPNGTVYSSEGDVQGPIKAGVGTNPPVQGASVPVSGGVVATAGTSGGIKASAGTASGGVKASSSATYAPASSIKWQWPTAGRVISGFSAAEGGNKGIDIAGTKGQDVRAAAAGRVVYAGDALRGYGNLIIIKHNDDFLSAYAHNDSIKVDEQDQVKAGQRIATMGSTGTNSTKLHFEIRYKGKSVDPSRYLPKR
ncbi:hypothetical protein A4G20_10405 [Pasteurellaceae bacterium RH1A]|nr:hypothetical protein A4G20_10405 [Pasteurellaceae bacterium RH1A]